MSLFQTNKTKRKSTRKLKSVKYRCPTPYPGKKTKCTTRYLKQKEKEKQKKINQ